MKTNHNHTRVMLCVGFASLAAMLFVLPSSVMAKDAATVRPNVLLIYTDDQGTLDVNCFGSKDLYTPNLDALAQRGVRFTQAYAHAVCCPSRAPLLTGRAPHRGNVSNWTPCHPDPNHTFGKGPNMRLEEITLAEALKPRGYHTGLIGKWHLGATPGFGPREQGFDEFFGHLGGFIDNYTHEFLHARKGEKPFHDLYRNETEVFENGKYFPDLVVRESNRFIETHRDEPFFLYVALNIPHYPEQADAKFTERYADMPMPRRSYAAMISTTDDRIGQILAKLDALNLREKTMIVWMSDNGHSSENARSADGRNYGANGGGGNTGRWRGAKGSFFEGGVRTPAIASFPGHIPEGQVRDQMVSNADFFPTILDACDVALPKDRYFDGKTLWPLLRSADTPSPHKVLHWQWANTWAVRQGDWKLIVGGRDSTEPGQGHPMRKGKLDKIFLGNLAEDNPELKNHAEEQPEIVERLTRLHEQWHKRDMP